MTLEFSMSYQLISQGNFMSTKNKTPIHQLPESGFLRLNQIVKHGKSTTPPLIPICRSSWLAGVKSGKYPPPVELGVRTKAWRVQDIRELIEKMGS